MFWLSCGDARSGVRGRRARDHSGGQYYFSATYTLDGATYPQIQVKTLPGSYPTQDVTFQLALKPPDIACHLHYGMVDSDVAGPVPAGITPARFSVALHGFDIDLRYFVRIGTR